MNVEDIAKHPLVFAATLVAIGVSSVANIKLSTDPTARPGAYTATMARDRAVTVDRRLGECDAADAAEENWRQAHVEWGRVMSIKQAEINSLHKAQIEEIYRRLP